MFYPTILYEVKDICFYVIFLRFLLLFHSIFSCLRHPLITTFADGFTLDKYAGLNYYHYLIITMLVKVINNINNNDNGNGNGNDNDNENDDGNGNENDSANCNGNDIGNDKTWKP